MENPPASPAAPAAPTTTAPAPAAKPSTPAGPRIKDVTPPTAVIHQIDIDPADVPAFLARIDPTAPAGRAAIDVSSRIGSKGELIIVIKYKP